MTATCTFCTSTPVAERKIFGRIERYCKGHLFYGNLEDKKPKRKGARHA